MKLCFHLFPKVVRQLNYGTSQHLSGGSDSFDGINGWEEYVIIDSAIKMKSKEESPVDELLLAKQEMKARILQASSGRDSTEPARVVDTQGIGRSQWW
jgi:hypothetical protein